MPRRENRVMAMKRFLFTFLAAASLVMFVPVTVVWVRSYWIGDSINLAWWNVSAQKRSHLELDFARGGTRVGYECQQYSDRAGFLEAVWGDLNDGLPTAEWEAPTAMEYPTLAVGTQNTTLGFGFFHDSDKVGELNSDVIYELVFPPGVLAGLLAVLPACWVVGAWRARRDGKREVGHCSHCGYDLRASKEICPECGNPVSQTLIKEAPLRRQRRQIWRAALLGVMTVVALGGLAAFGAVHYWNAQHDAYERQWHLVDLGVALLQTVDVERYPGPADLGEIRRLLDAGADPGFVIGPSARRPSGGRYMNWGPPLCISAFRGDTEAVKFLLSRGADINGRNGDNMTPLSFAAGFGHLEILRFLLAHGADPNIADSHGDSPLTMSLRGLCQGEDPAVINQIADALISGGVNINARNNDGASPLLLATKSMNWELAKKLIELGADVNIADNQGQTPLITARYLENVQMVQLLVQNGAKK